MSGGAAIQLTTAVEHLPGIAPVVAEGLRGLGLTNLGRLVAHLPMRHERLEAETPIHELVVGAIGSARGEVTDTRPFPRGPRPRFQAVMHDGASRLELVWFNVPYMRERVMPGVRVRVQGLVKRYKGGVQMVNPRLEVLRENEPPERGERLRPVYPASERCDSRMIERAIGGVLAGALPLIEDHLPEGFRRERGLPTLAEAYRMQHAPRDEGEAAAGRRRLAYDELLLLQLGVHLKRAQLRSRMQAPALRHSPARDAEIRRVLPHTPTAHQEAVIAEIAGDLSTTTPMNRLVQGDVGSGKTLVAVYAMLLAVLDRHQAALMAPTEILAEQHFIAISGFLKATGVRVELLTGAVQGAERESLLSRLAEGRIDILIGTHALLTESVRFSSLALAIIDEQHRFGVHQRASLREKASDEFSTPHVLVMTATPIPRTLAITLFGDLDISVIRGLPPGRTPVLTRVVHPDERAEVYGEIAERLERKEQAFVVAPAIEAGELGAGGESLRDVRTVQRELETEYLAGRRIAAVHGQLSRAMREHVMERFRSGLIDVLVATTVIEVGVDVPGATVMVVEQADRFGLAQLHQLRGRVGRGERAAVCYLMADPATPGGEERLGVLAKTTDGFVVAEKDLEIRGPGELFGSRQWGLPPLKVADLMKDRELLALARRDAAEWIRRSPYLRGEDEQTLRRRLMKTYGEELGLVDVG